MDSFSNLPVWVQTLILTSFTCVMTILGSSVVFFFKKVNQKIINIMLSLSAGVMIASAFFSLLIPSINQSEELFNNSFFMPSFGFLVGGLFVVLSDIFLEKMLKNNKKMQKNSKKSQKNQDFSKNIYKNNQIDFKKQILLVVAITLHNIPEGMCVGVSLASNSLGFGEGIMASILLAIGIGIQNFPEGASVSLPIRSQGKSRLKAFMFGSFSGIVEPIFALIACLFISVSQILLPFLLAFSSGAMISVACMELIPESVSSDKNLTTIFVLLGFIIMMILDLAF